MSLSPAVHAGELRLSAVQARRRDGVLAAFQKAPLSLQFLWDNRGDADGIRMGSSFPALRRHVARHSMRCKNRSSGSRG